MHVCVPVMDWPSFQSVSLSTSWDPEIGSSIPTTLHKQFGKWIFFCVCVYVCVSVSVCEWKRQLFPSDAMCPEEGTEDWNGAAHIWSLYKHVLAWPTCASVMTELLTLEILQMLPYNRKARYTSAKHKGTHTANECSQFIIITWCTWEN